jgi:branched-chain amino acid transport system permease protein
MSARRTQPLLLGTVLIAGMIAPFLLPAYQVQLSLLWIMIVFSLTWDVVGGQMGYNSFGNIVFFGIGMYVCACTQIGLFYNLAQYTAATGAITAHLTQTQYFTGLGLGLVLAAVAAVAVAVILGTGILGLRGHYFAIGTLGLGVAAGEIASGIDVIGAGSGMVAPIFPGTERARQLFFYYLCMLLGIATFLCLRWLYHRRFGLAINAIRDDEDKAEALGIPTTRYKTVAWAVSALFLGLAGGLVGNILSFIDPLDTAFAASTFGVWMVLMALLGGKGTLWGPVIGAVVYHVIKELFWVYLLGWQQVALGVLIILIVLFFPEGILGWLRQRTLPRDAGGAAGTGRDSAAGTEARGTGT